MIFQNKNDFLKNVSSSGRLIALDVGTKTIGIAVAVLSKRVAKAIRKVDEVNEDDKIVLGMRVAGLVFALIALILVAYGSNLVL